MTDLEKTARGFQRVVWSLSKIQAGYLVGETGPEIVLPADPDLFLIDSTYADLEFVGVRTISAAPFDQDSGNTETFFHWANGEDYWQYRARWEKPDPQNRA